MARTIQDTFYERTVTAGEAGLSPAEVWADQMGLWLQDIQTNGVSAWSEEETGLTGPAQNQSGGVAYANMGGGGGAGGRIYRTYGDRTIGPNGAGDSSGVIVLDVYSTTQMRFWSGHDYGWITSNDPTDPRRFATPNAFLLNFNLVASTEFYMAATINEYGVFTSTNTGASWFMIAFELPVRKNVPLGQIGVAKTTDVVTGTGSNQVIPIDRNISNQLVVGEEVWIVPQTASGAEFESPVVERLPVVAITSSSITLAPSNTYAAGALIGFDPCCLLMSTNTSGGAYSASIDEGGDVSSAAAYTAQLATSIVKTQNDPSGPIDGGTSNASSADSGVTITISSGTFDNERAGDVFTVLSGPERGKRGKIATVGATSITLEGTGIGANFTNETWEINRGPALYHGYRSEYGSSAGFTGYRGVSSLLWGCTSNGLVPQSRANGDVNRDNLDNNRLFAPYPNFTIFTSSFEPNFGPFSVPKT